MLHHSVRDVLVGKCSMAPGRWRLCLLIAWIHLQRSIVREAVLLPVRLLLIRSLAAAPLRWRRSTKRTISLTDRQWARCSRGTWSLQRSELEDFRGVLLLFPSNCVCMCYSMCRNIESLTSDFPNTIPMFCWDDHQTFFNPFNKIQQCYEIQNRDSNILMHSSMQQLLWLFCGSVNGLRAELRLRKFRVAPPKSKSAEPLNVCIV